MALHTTRRLSSAAFGLALVGASGIAFAGAAQADPNPNITICHATGNPDKFVVLTIDAAAITQQGHDTHQDDRDVIPPFEYVAENSDETVSFPGQNWDDNWATNGEGVATEPVDKADCGPGEEPSPSPTPTVTVTVTPTPTTTVTVTPTPTTTVTPTPTTTITPTPTTTITPTPTTTVTPTPTMTVTPTPTTTTTPTGPVVETDRVEGSGSNVGLVTGGVALLLAGAATLAATRRRGSHS